MKIKGVKKIMLNYEDLSNEGFCFSNTWKNEL